jgi:hypothetical protein
MRLPVLGVLAFVRYPKDLVNSQNAHLLRKGSYAGALWAMLRALYLGGMFVHQWDITLRDFEHIIYASPLLATLDKL